MDTDAMVGPLTRSDDAAASCGGEGCGACLEASGLMRVNVTRAFDVLQAAVADGALLLYAGNCCPGDVPVEALVSDHDSVTTVLRCSSCGSYWRAGIESGVPSCGPITGDEVEDMVERVGAEPIEWGYVGARYVEHPEDVPVPAR